MEARIASAVLVKRKAAVAVRGVDVIADRALQFERTAMRAATKLPVRELGEEALDLIDPDAPLGVKWT